MWIVKFPPAFGKSTVKPVFVLGQLGELITENKILTEDALK